VSFAILRCPLKAVSGIPASEFEQQIASALCLMCQSTGQQVEEKLEVYAELQLELCKAQHEMDEMGGSRGTERLCLQGA